MDSKTESLEIRLANTQTSIKYYAQVKYYAKH